MKKFLVIALFLIPTLANAQQGLKGIAQRNDVNKGMTSEEKSEGRDKQNFKDFDLKFNRLNLELGGQPLPTLIKKPKTIGGTRKKRKSMRKNRTRK